MSQVSAVIKEMIRQQLLTLHTCLVCKVLELYSDGTAKVQPCTMMQTAKGTVKQHVALDGVPILDQIRSTISVGKACVVVFAERDISAVRYAEFALPSASRHHSLSDGIIIGTIDGSGTVIPGESSAPLPSETATAKTSTNKKANGTEVQVDVKVSRQSGNKLQAKSDGLFVPESPDTNTTYNISKDGSTLKLTGSDGSESSVAIPESKNTTYRVSSGIFPSSHGVTLRGSDGSNSIAPLETYRRSLNLSDVTARDMNRVTERGYLVSTYGYAFKLTMSRYDSSHNFEMDGSYIKDDESFNFNIRGDISVIQSTVTISNLSIECDDPDNQLSVYAYNVFESASEDHDYVYYYAWLAVYSKKDLTGWTSAHLASIHYTDGEYIELSTPPDSEHSVNYIKMEEQVVKTLDENTKYELSKTGNTITLIGSDGSIYTITDSNTVYRLEQYASYYDTNPKAPKVLLMSTAAGNDTEITVPNARTSVVGWNPLYTAGYGNLQNSNKYASLGDILFAYPDDNNSESLKIHAHFRVKYGIVEQYFDVFICTNRSNHSYAEILVPSKLSPPSIQWTVLFTAPGVSEGFETDSRVFRICIDQESMKKIRYVHGIVNIDYLTGYDGGTLKPVQKTDSVDEYLKSFHDDYAMPTNVILSSENASNVAFTGDYNDLSNKPTIPDISGKQDKSTAVTHTANTAVGSATKPVYIAANGSATPISHSINSDVPANAKFTDTTYSDATQSAHGLMTAADKKKLDGMDLTKYLPLSGGVMTGNIDLASNGVDLLVGTQRAVQGTYASAVAGATVAAKEPLKTGLPKRKSLIGSWLDQNSAWHSILSVRHRNGWNDGPSYGFYLRSLLTSNGNLCWNKQTGVDKWQGERVLLDSINYSSYAAPLSHTHRDIDQIGNVGYYGSDEADSNGWYKIYSGTLTGYADRVARLSIVRSYGKGYGIVLFHLRCNNNSSIIIHDLLWETRYKFDENHIAIKTNKNEYGIYVYQNSVQWGRIKVRVLESCGTSSNWTMTISNNSTKESSFTPTATGKDGSTVAKANEADTLTETAWTDVPETNISPRYGKNIKYLKSGNTVYVRGSISFSASLNNPCCGTMPSELLPDDYQDHVFTAWNLKGGVPTAYPVVLGTDGKIILMNPTSTANWFVAGRAYNFNFNYHIG